MVIHRYLLLCAVGDTVHLLLYIRTVFDVLVGFANVAVDGVPGFEAERYDWEEAEGEKLPGQTNVSGSDA